MKWKKTKQNTYKIVDSVKNKNIKYNVKRTAFARLLEEWMNVVAG